MWPTLTCSQASSMSTISPISRRRSGHASGHAGNTLSVWCTRIAPREMFAPNSEQPGQRRPTGRGLPLFRHGDQAFALGLFPGCLTRASDGFRLLAGLALGRFFIRLAALHLSKNALALHLLFEHPESLIDIVVSNEYLQNAFQSCCWRFDARRSRC